METSGHRNTLRNAIWSVAVSLIFMWLAAGSFYLVLGTLAIGPRRTIEYHKSNDTYTEFTYSNTSSLRRSEITGKRDAEGRWYGPVEIVYYSGLTTTTESCFLQNGERHGKSVLTTYDKHGMVSQRSDAYVNGIRIGSLDNPGKSAPLPADGRSAYDLLRDEYPWFLYMMMGFGFDSAYVKAYTDTLETLLHEEEFEMVQFNNKYDSVVSVLEETPCDSLISINSEMFLVRGLEMLKNNEFRLAIIDHCRHPEKSTYSIISVVYPNYLQFLADSGVTNLDFEQFCLDVEDSLTSYGPLDLSDPFFTDSVDVYLFMAVFGMLESLESVSAMATESLKAAREAGTLGNGYGRTIPLPQILKVLSTSPEVAAVVASDMINSDFIRGDILRAAVRKAWLLKKGVVVLPTTVTELSEYLFDTGVTMKGYVSWDGGSAVTARGIVWAEYYDPTTSDHTLASGSGTGEFSMILSGLEKGKTYYARSYAVNSAGTAYGNCVKFVASVPVGIEVPTAATGDLQVFPNPSSGKVILRFSLEAPATVGLIVTDMAGRKVMLRNAGLLPQGWNQMTVDFSSLKEGVYICRLNSGSEGQVRKIVIQHSN